MDIGSKTVDRIVQTLSEDDSQRYDSAVEDARYTLNKQIECAENRKDELIRAIYFNIIIFGSFITILSLSPSRLKVSDLLWFIGGAGILWLLSTGLAIRGLHESGLNVRFSVEGLDQIVEKNHSDTESSKIRLGMYKKIIETNENIGNKCGIFATTSIILTIYSIFIISLGIVGTMVSAIPPYVYLLIGGLLIGLAYPLKQDFLRLLGLAESESEVIHVDEFL